MAGSVLRIRRLSVAFPQAGQELMAVRNLDLDAPAGAITCIVGESGCGKSLTCRSILRLTPENAQLSGNIFFRNQDMLAISEKELRSIRGASIGMIFQEPMTSLNPVLTIGMQTAEPLRLHKGLSRKQAHEAVLGLFQSVGIPAPADRYNDYPHQLSGGMRQRVMIAMALSCQPALLLADEPTTALDVTIQGQILKLIQTESRNRNMAVVLVTHDLGIVADMADYVGVMYGGILAEYAPVRELFEKPLHPYAIGLINSAPDRSSVNLKKLPFIPGVVPALDEMPPGCPFQPRCSQDMPICAQKVPPTFTKLQHKVACWLYADSAA